MWVFMANNNVDYEPLVIHDSQGHTLKYHPLIVEFYGHKAVEYGEKYSVILVSQTILLTYILAILVF